MYHNRCRILSDLLFVSATGVRYCLRFILTQIVSLLHHAVIRKGTFAKYDYGWVGNLARYGQLHPPPIHLSSIPESLPLWMGYGGLDALADVTDVEHTIKQLRSTPELLYIGFHHERECKRRCLCRLNEVSQGPARSAQQLLGRTPLHLYTMTVRPCKCVYMLACTNGKPKQSIKLLVYTYHQKQFCSCMVWIAAAIRVQYMYWCM
jgi:hypothetical protein